MLDEKTDEQNQSRGLSRRQFLRWVGAGAAASVLAASGLGLLRPLSAEAAFKAARAPAHDGAAHAVRPRGGDPV